MRDPISRDGNSVDVDLWYAFSLGRWGRMPYSFLLLARLCLPTRQHACRIRWLALNTRLVRSTCLHAPVAPLLN
jgi:hypothetical protein